MPNFRFDEESHTYYVDDRLVPSVNQVMEGVGVQDYSFIPAHERDWYFTRGSFVHYAVELLLKGELDWDSLDERIVGYVRAAERFIKDTGFKPICIEKPLYHPDWGYAGTGDVVGTIDGREIVADWKSGIVSSWVKWQTGAYAELYRVNGIANPMERMGIQLMDDGKYKATETWTNPNDLNEFLCFLTTYKRQKLRIKDGNAERVAKAV